VVARLNRAAGTRLILTGWLLRLGRGVGYRSMSIMGEKSGSAPLPVL